jgi:hypothetical protein
MIKWGFLIADKVSRGLSDQVNCMTAGREMLCQDFGYGFNSANVEMEAVGAYKYFHDALESAK